MIAVDYKIHKVLRSDALENPQHQLTKISYKLDKLRFHNNAIDKHLSAHKIISPVKPDEYY